jgi:hypothetical protein
MIVLNSTLRKLEVVLAGTVTTNQLQVTTHFTDTRAAGVTGIGSQVSNTNNTTDVDIVSSPTSGVTRAIDSITIYNKDTVAATVTCKYSDNGTEYILVKATLTAGDTLQYENDHGWWVVDSTGATKISGGGGGGSGSITIVNATGDGTTTTFDLGMSPANEASVFVFQDGVFQNNDQWSLSGNNIIFTTAPASGVAIEVRIVSSLSIGTPADDTVSTVKIQDGAVTYDKLDSSVKYPMVAFKNAIINGAMEVWQRGTSFAAITNTSFGADRWQYQNGGTTAVHTYSRSTDVPTVSEAGVLAPYSVLVDCTTADGTIAAGDYCAIRQNIEGYVWRKFAQRACTLSFWVRATKTGIYTVSFRNNEIGVPDRSLVLEYTVNASNVWEKKTLSVPASPSAGTWDYTNGPGLGLWWNLCGGSTYYTTPGTWNVGNFLSTSNQVNALDSTSNDFKLTLVQFEVGNEATEFEDIPFEVELARCMRYYEKSYDYATDPGTGTAAGCLITNTTSGTTLRMGYRFQARKRTSSGTMTIYSTATGASGNMRNNSAGSDLTVTVGPVIGEMGGYFGSNGATADNEYIAQYTYSSEL